MDLLVGKVTHFYDKIGVAIVQVEDQSIKLGDVLKFSGHDQEFTQKVNSMQLEHEKIEQASKGAVVGIKVEQKVKVSDRVYLVS